MITCGFTAILIVLTLLALYGCRRLQRDLLSDADGKETTAQRLIEAFPLLCTLGVVSP
jgi:hypothetical protein